MKAKNRKLIQDIFLLVLFPSNLWILFRLLLSANAALEQGGVNELIAFGSYHLAFALVESLFVMLPLSLLAFVLARFFDPPRVPGAITAFYLSVAMLLLTYRGAQFFDPPLALWFAFLRRDNLLLFGFIEIMIWGLSLGVIGFITWGAIARESFNLRMQALLERIKPLSWLYLALDVAGVFVVVWRNLT
jgi:hypothetical protein